MKKTIDGNEAVALSSYLFTEISSIYPITPSSPMAEHISNWADQNKKNIFDNVVKVVEMQSEAGASGMMHGSLVGGSLTTTFTASQGLLLMIPNMYKMAGELLPGVIHVAARTIATHALSIMGDHSDVYATINSGCAYLSSSNVQEAHDLALIAHLCAIKGELPVVHFMDGFRTSHELQKIDIIDDKEAIKKLIDFKQLKKFRDKSINLNLPSTRGTAQNDDVFFQMTESRNKYYYEFPKIVEDYMEKLSRITKRKYNLFEYYGSARPKKIIIAMGSVIDTIKEVVDDLGNVGVINVHLFRPFSINHLINAIPKSVERIAVLDRAKTPGASGEPLYLDVVNALKDKDIEILGGRYGLSSKNVNPKDIKSVYDFLDNKNRFNGFTVGINDDLSNLSIDIDTLYNLKDKSVNMLIYGYGSDGMVSCSKSILKIVGDNTKSYVQGYFQYDSKKSGGLTKCHLRIANDKIRSPYYIENSDIVVVTKESYLDLYDILSTIKNKGIFLLNTSSNNLNETIPDNIKQIIKEKELRFYVIKANELSAKHNLPNKISTVMESAIFYITNMLEYKAAKKKIKDSIKKTFAKKGEIVINNNINLIDEVEECVKQIDNDTLIYDTLIKKEDKLLYEIIRKDKGNTLPTSAFVKNPNGTFIGGTSSRDKRRVSSIVASWINNNCTTCNQCSIVCPHGVITPTLIDNDEYDVMPKYIQDRCIDLVGNDEYKFILDISIEDCTGCGLCVKTCPAKNKALTMNDIDSEELNKIDEIHEYLSKNITNKNVINPNTIRGVAFRPCNFKYSGACSGCGETPYIKLLTQVVGEKLVIANATGCSSIYGGSIPSLPYTVNWANSLFEDAAEFGYGILLSETKKREEIKDLMKNNINKVSDYNKELFKDYLDNDGYANSKKVYDDLDYETLPKEIVDLKEYIKKSSVWTIGGDGWAYDIGYSGIDHIASLPDNSRILILDTEVYSNTGGQASKSTMKGATALFASSGKKTNKKDMVKILMGYKNIYIGTISLGSNMNHALKVLKEAEEFQGPSIVIAYAPCIAHGIKGGMGCSIEEERKAVECGYFPLIRYNGLESKLYLDKKEVDFDLLDEFLSGEKRFNSDNRLLESTKEYIVNRFNYFLDLSQK